MNRFLRAKLSFVAQIVSQVCVNQTQLIHHRNLRRLKVSLLGLRSLKLSLEGFFFVIGEVRIASPKRITLQDKATVLPLEANVALPCIAFASSKAQIASLLALSLASRQTFLPLDALSLTLRQRFLAPGAVNESDTESATLLADKDALALASHDRRG